MVTKASALVEPADRLITQEHIDDEVTRIEAMLDVADTARFVDDMAVFNPLLELASRNRKHFRNVVRVVMRKRAERGYAYAPLRRLLSGETEEERLAWQESAKHIANEANRNYVAETRRRLRRLVQIENLMRGPATQLKGPSRLAFMNKKWHEWAERRKAILDTESDRVGGRISRERMRELIDGMWDAIDKELDAEELKVMKRRYRA